MNWTKAQLDAINDESGDILLSAAAGSGKTTVMVERIYRLVKSGCDLESFLIITFTRAAAADMKRKLIKRFSEDASDVNVLNALDSVERASISTIDAYCSGVLRQHFEAANVDPGFRILDDAEERQLQSQAIDEALEKAIADPDEGLVSLLFGREIKSVKQIIKETYDFSRAQPDPEAFLENSLVTMPSGDGEIWFSTLLSVAKNYILEAVEIMKKCVELCRRIDGPNVYLPSVLEDENVISYMLDLDYDGTLAEVTSFVPTKIKALRYDESDKFADTRKLLGERVKTLRKTASDRLSKVAVMLPVRDEALQDMHLSLPSLAALKKLCLMYGKELWALKTERMAMSFTDVAQLALKALADSDVAKYQKARYEYVFVDEYQDVSDLQEAIIKRVAQPGKLFMVGDVKQSIYRFRQAVPELFIEKYNRFSTDGGGKLIPLCNNFRSRGAVIDFVNDVFSTVMNAPTSEIAYKKDALLVKTADFKGCDVPVEAHLIDKQSDWEDWDEPRMTASIIKSLIGQRLSDDDDRLIRPGDIAVIARTRDTLRLIDQALGQLNVKSYVDAAEGYLEAVEVRIMLSVMRAIENRRRDFPLIETLRSPIFSITSTQLAQIRARFPDGAYCDSFNRYMELDDGLAERLREIKSMFDRWRFLSRAMPLSDWIDLLLNETGFYAYVGALPSGRSRQANLDLLCNYASDFSETKSAGLTGFLDYIADVESLGGDMSAAHSAEDIGDCVVLLTAHKSKGLEFPVVIASGLGKDLGRTRPDKTELRTHRTLGAGLYYNDSSLGTRRDTLSRMAIEAKCKTESLEEEKRVLYVMLTRAVDRLILTGTVSSRDEWLFKASTPELSAIRPTSFLDMVSVALDSGKVYFDEPETSQDAQSETEQDSDEQYDEQAVREALMWKYPHESEAWQPVKMTVTGLARELTGALEASPLLKQPKFLSDAGKGAERGTAVHMALSRVNLDGVRGLAGRELFDKLKADVESMYQAGIIASVVDARVLARFFERDIGKRLLESNEVRREWQFNLRMSVREALKRDSDSFMIVQGMIDCCFKENGNWVLIDYKTDGLKEEAPEEYVNQVRLYAVALKRITGIDVKQAYLCFLTAGTEVEVTPEQ